MFGKARVESMASICLQKSEVWKMGISRLDKF